MINIIRSEWIKMRTIRMNYVLFILAVALPLIICTLTAIFVGEFDVDEEGIVGVINGTAVITGMLLGVIGAASITGEFGFNTIRPTFAAVPRRRRVLIAKAIVVAAMAAVAQMLVVGLCHAVMRGILSARDVTIEPFQPYLTYDDSIGATGKLVTFSLWPPIIGIVIFAVIVALLGYAIGLLIHNTPAAIAVLVLWPLVVEGLVSGLLFAAGVTDPTRFMPYQSGFQLGAPTIGAEGLGRLGGGLYFGAVTLAALVIGALVTERRDA